MIRAALKIRCPNCGREEEIIRTFDDRVVDFNLDKPCPTCHWVWMTDKHLTLTKTP